jgi:hypothetical protein
MNLFLLSVLSVAREFFDAVDSIRQLCHSYFSGDFKVTSHFLFADDFWSVGTQFSLTIPRVNDDSVFSIDFIRQP